MYVNLSNLLRLKNPALDFVVFNSGGMVAHQMRRKLGYRLFKRFQETSSFVESYEIHLLKESLHSSPCNYFLYVSKDVSLHEAILNSVNLGSFPSQKGIPKISEILRDIISNIKYVPHIISLHEVSLSEREKTFE